MGHSNKPLNQHMYGGQSRPSPKRYPYNIDFEGLVHKVDE